MFYGRIVRKDDASFQCMVAEMTSYYADTKPTAKEVLEGELYAVQEDEEFHRFDMNPEHSRRFKGSYIKTVFQYFSVNEAV